MKAYLGIDIGTTAVKAALFDGQGAMLGGGLAEYTLETPAPDIVELDAETYVDAVRDAVAKALAAAKLQPMDVRSVGITGQAETLICVDADGVPLRKAINWLDNRAKTEAADIEKQFGMDWLLKLSGQTEMLPCWPAAKIRWLAANEPQVFAKTAKYLMVEDFIAHKLTGVFATCVGLMPSTIYYDIATEQYDASMLRYLNISESQLPSLKQPGEIAGRCVAGNLCGFAANTPVSICPLDHVAGCLGAGGGPGVVTETTGCTLAACATLPKLLYDESRQLGTYYGFTPQSYVFLPWAPTAGMLLRHFRDYFSNGLDYRQLDELAAQVPPGSDGLVVLPHCAGAVSPQANPNARGVIYGLTLAHKQGHIARALMEAVAALLKDNLDALERFGVEIHELRALGGASKSPLWLQIKADLLDKTVTTLACDEATSLGAAMLGAIAAGDFADAAAAQAAMVHAASSVSPGENVAAYKPYFAKYQEINNLLLKTF